MPSGRLSKFDPKIAREICSHLADGKSLRAIQKLDPSRFPPPSTVCEWVLDHKEFAEQYASSRQLQAQILADELFDIADDGSGDYAETEDGRLLNSEHINRSRLRIDTRKWYLSKVLPKIYGDKLQHTGADGDGPIEISVKRVGGAE